MKADELKELQSKKSELDKQITKLRNESAGIRNILYSKIEVPKAKALLGKCFTRKGNGGKWDVFKVTGNDGGLATGARVWRSVSKGRYGHDETRINRKDFINLDNLNEWREITPLEFEKRVSEMLEI